MVPSQTQGRTRNTPHRKSADEASANSRLPAGALRDTRAEPPAVFLLQQPQHAVPTAVPNPAGGRAGSAGDHVHVCVRAEGMWSDSGVALALWTIFAG